MKTSAKIIVILFTFTAILMEAKPSYAYLDPGTGSFALQMLIASVVGGLFFIKKMWVKIKGIFSTKKNDESDENRE